MDNSKNEFAGLLGVLATIASVGLTLFGFLLTSVQLDSAWDQSPKNPLNMPQLSWHEIRSHSVRPDDGGRYDSTIHIEVKNASRVAVKDVEVYIRTLTDDPCIACDGGIVMKATGKERLVKFSQLNGNHSLKITVVESLEEFPEISFLNSLDGYGTSGWVTRASYEHGQIEEDRSLSKSNSRRLEPRKVVAAYPPAEVETALGTIPASDDSTKFERNTTTPTLQSARPMLQKQSKPTSHSCGCGKPNCRCGSRCRCRR